MAIHPDVVVTQVGVAAHRGIIVLHLYARTELGRKHEVDRTVYGLPAQFPGPLVAGNIHLDGAVLRVQLHIAAAARVGDWTVLCRHVEGARAVSETDGTVLSAKFSAAIHAAHRHRSVMN